MEDHCEHGTPEGEICIMCIMEEAECEDMYGGTEDCPECGEFDCMIDHEVDEDWGDNSDNDTGYEGECS